MNGFLLFTFTVSIAISCMALALSIASRILYKTPWGGKYIVFQSCLIGILVVSMVSKLSLFFIPDSTIIDVLEFIFDVIVIASMGFVVAFLPFFLSWVIAKPWRRTQSLVFIPLGICYFGVGLTNLLFTLFGKTFLSFWSTAIQTAICLGVYIYCIVTLWINLKSIDAKPIRNICLSINIVSLSLIPLSILSLFFANVASFSYPIYVFAFSIIIVIDNQVRIGLDTKERDKQPNLSSESLACYKISEREFEVIKLICEGYTNKEIAEELSISVNTVNNHVANIFSKMDVRSRIDLLKALKEGPWT